MTDQAVTDVKEFQPPSVQNFNGLYPGYAHRLCDTNPGNKRGDRLRYWQNQGWEVAPYGNEGQKGNRKTGATSDDGAVHYRGLVLLRIKMSAAAARNKYYREKHTRLIEASQTARKLAGLANQRKNGDTQTSAFARSTREQDRGGRRVTVSESSFDSSKETAESVRRDADPGAMQELRDRMDQMMESQRKIEQENQRLAAELAEQKKKPSDRKRKSFPVS